MARFSWTAKMAIDLAKKVVDKKITPTVDMLTPARILEIANKAVERKGYAEYADFAEDLFLEIMACRPPYGVGWRLNEPRNVLRANLWRVEGRPTKFFPPKR